MGDSQGTRTTFQTFVSLVQALVWPAIVIIMMIVLRTPVTSLVNRTNITKATLPGGAEFTFAAVIVQSGRQEIAAQVAPLPVTPIEEATKGSPDLIPDLIRAKIQALDLTLGYGGYLPQALQAHFDALLPYSFFRYVIFMQTDHRIFGIMEARALVSLLQDQKSGLTYSSFTEAVNRGNSTDRARLAQLPSFVPESESVSDRAEKREVLEKMEKTGREWLPVVRADNGHLGIVDRSRLTASIVLDVTNRAAASQAPTTPQSQN